jgi:hypothetical protein
MNPGTTVRIEAGEDAAIASHSVVDPSDVIERVSMEEVVVGGAALVGAEFLVAAATHGLVTVGAVHDRCFHGDNVFDVEVVY